MEQVTLRARSRAMFGTRPSRRMRRDGLVPATVYGHKSDALSIAVSERELYTVLHTEAGRNALITVEIEGGESVLAVAREIQRHPVRGDVIHLDLIRVSLDETIEAEVAIEYLGTPVGIKEDGGFVEMISATVNIEALSTAIPSSIAIDISELHTGETLKVADLPELDGVTYIDEIDRPLVTVLPPRLVEEALAEEVAVEGIEEDGVPGEAAEGSAEEEA